MDLKVKNMYREIEKEHSDKPYNSLPKAIQTTIKDETLSATQKLEIIEAYVDLHFQELSYVGEEEYL